MICRPTSTDIHSQQKNLSMKKDRLKIYMYGAFKTVCFSFFGVGWGLWMKAGRKEEGASKSHFLMLSRRAAVLYCVAWGLFSPANLSMLQWPAWLWPPDALYRATTKAGECCLVPQCAPLIALLYTTFPRLPSRSFTHLQAGRQAGRPAHSGPQADVSV